MFHKGKISYVFEVRGKRYGNAVKVQGRTALDYVQASFNLIINYLETKDAAEKA